jgi:hypothetical protein
VVVGVVFAAALGAEEVCAFGAAGFFGAEGVLVVRVDALVVVV